jgi:hypothetical protein
LPGLGYQRLEGDFKLTEEEIRKPLFCWMFAIMVSSEFYNEIILKESANPSMTRALIYEGFTHSIIRGKHQSVANQYFYSQYYYEEKKVGRIETDVRTKDLNTQHGR